MAFLAKLREKRIWERLLRERLSEPVHLNILAIFVGALGSFETKVYFDLVIRQPLAFSLLQAARWAKQAGHRGFVAVEFGVAEGAGLLNMAALARKVTACTGMAIEVVGFDSGTGMPPPKDYRDHPRFYREGDFPMRSRRALIDILPPHAKLKLGPIAEAVPAFLKTMKPEMPIGFVSIDVDYYSSAMESFALLIAEPELYLPEVIMYLDDIHYPQHNRWQGEYLAVEDFNAAQAWRKIGPYNFLRCARLFKNAQWIDQMYLLHVLDHATQSMSRAGETALLPNAYLRKASWLTSPTLPSGPRHADNGSR